ncbi:hypothetical protein AArcCO_4152 (plasmid) [Halalkaliarchaeum sp. AArc-CO]|nr:hypothetical protein AArcCO_4152 [Halalkaliarchaeum sp. AArc-CO]
MNGFPRPSRPFSVDIDSVVISESEFSSSIDANRIDPERSIFLDDDGDSPAALMKDRMIDLPY